MFSVQGKRLAIAGSAVLAALALQTSAFSADREVRVYNWSDYIEPSILEDFTKETGIKVVYDIFDSNDILETKLLAGKTGYDIVVPTGSFLARQIQAGVFMKLDKSKLPNLTNQWPDVSDRLAKYDPGNEHAVNYMWGTTGIGYNVKKIKERMPDAPVDSWKLVFDPEIVMKFKDCGIMMLDASDEITAATMNYLGLDPNSKNPEDFKKAAEHFKKIRPADAQVPLVGIHQRSGQWRRVHRRRLVGRRRAGQDPRRRKEREDQGREEEGRTRLFRAEGRRADVVRQSRHSAATQPS